VSARAHACLRARVCVLCIYLSYFTSAHTHTHAFTHINTPTHTHTHTYTFCFPNKGGGWCVLCNYSSTIFSCVGYVCLSASINVPVCQRVCLERSRCVPGKIRICAVEISSGFSTSMISHPTCFRVCSCVCVRACAFVHTTVIQR